MQIKIRSIGGGDVVKKLLLLCMAFVLLALVGGCGTERADEGHGKQLVFGSKNYDQINPLLNEYGVIEQVLFDGLMRRDATGATVPGLAESYEYDPETYTYVFRLRDGVSWHDGKPLRAADVKFTIEAIRDSLTDSLNTQNFEDVREITELDDKTVRIRLSAPNTAFLDYMVQPILPAHLLAGRDLRTTGFFRSPVGTGPFRIDRWEAGHRIVLVKNEDYYRGAPKVDSFVFKIIEDDVTEAQALADGQIDAAHLAPTNAAQFMGNPAYRCYDMKTTDYRAILFNFAHPYWQRNRDLIPAISYAIDRQALIDKALLGYGTPAYGPLQRNVYNNPNVERYDYNPAKARALLEAAGCVRGADGYYMRGGEEVGFRLTVRNDNFARIEIVHAAAEQLCAAGIHCTVETPAQIDWDRQMAYLIGWGSQLDPDVHTYKVFTTNGKANMGRYSNARVDDDLLAARRTSDPDERMRLYGVFQEELAKDPPCVFLCYIDAVYVVSARVHGIAEDNLLGHRGIGFFWNVNEWTVE
jgi:hypothetical protein